ncbi:MAG: ATP-binding protein [Thermodesulfobacteriota bacterium]
METWHEREVLTKSSLADLDESLLAQFGGKSLSLAEAEKILYRPYGLIAYLHGVPLLTRAALYLWAKDPLRWHARPGLEFIRLEGNKKEDGPNYNIKERLRLEGPILRIIAELNDFIEQHIQERVIRQDLFFKEKFVYPVAALKEVIINALAHRDYSLEGRAIEVYMYDDRLEVVSPGGLPGFLKVDHLQEKEGVHYARNPLMVRVLTDMGIMHSVGKGFWTIFGEMQKNGLNPPEIKVSGNCVQVVLKNAPLMDESTLLWLKNFKAHILNSRQIRILAYGRAHGLIFSSADYQKLGVDRDTAYLEIKELINKGIVKPLKRHGKIYQIIEPGRT